VKSKLIVDHVRLLDVMAFKKKKRAEKQAKESQKTKEKVYDDYASKDMCEDSTKLKQLRAPELIKYLKHHRLDQHNKSTKNDKVKVILRHWLLQMNPEGPDALIFFLYFILFICRLYKSYKERVTMMLVLLLYIK